jgi:hypothetical protein
MSFIQNMMEKQNNVFILIKKNMNPEFSNKEILGVYSSQEIALKEKQKHSFINTLFQYNIEGPFIIDNNLSPSVNPKSMYPDPIYVEPDLNKPLLPRFKSKFPDIK